MFIMFRSNFGSRQICFTEIVMTQPIAVITRPQHQFYKTFLASDQTQQVAIEELFSPEHQFGIFGETQFRSIQGQHVYYIDTETGKLQYETTNDGAVLPRRSTGKVVSMLKAGLALADMATEVWEAASKEGSVLLVLGDVNDPTVVPTIEEKPGVDLDAKSLPPTPRSASSDGSAAS